MKYFLSALCLCLSQLVLSQNELLTNSTNQSIKVDSVFTGKRMVDGQHQFSLFLGGGLSSLNFNPELGSLKNGAGYTAGIDYSYYWVPKWGITFGLVFDQYSSSNNLEQSSITTRAIDVDGDEFDLLTSFNGLTERQKTVTMALPILFKFRLPLSSRYGFLFDAGPKFSWSIVKNTKVTSGEFTTMGRYDFNGPNDPPISGQEDLGFWTYAPRDQKSVKMGIGISIAGNINVYYKLNSFYSFYCGPYFEYQLNKTAKPSDVMPLVTYNTPEILGQPTTSSYNSVTRTQGYDGAKRLAFGVKVGLIFDLGNKWNQSLDKKEAKQRAILAEEAAQKAREKAKLDSIAAVEARQKAQQDSIARALALAEAIRLSEEMRIKDSIENAKNQGASVVMDIRTKSLSDDELEVLKLPVVFKKDKYDLEGQSKINAQKIGSVLAKHPELKIGITGHTCDLGSESYNYQLGLKRAKSLNDEFVIGGVKADNASIKSKGELEPFVPNIDEVNRQKNRRVVVVVEDEKLNSQQESTYR